MKTILTSSILLLGACAAETKSEATCPIGNYRDMIGQPVGNAIFPLALNHRVISPGQAVTMDHAPDRLNVSVDTQSRITGLSCG